MFTIKPLDEALVLKCAQETGAIVTAENHSVYGGLGAAVAEFLGEMIQQLWRELEQETSSEKLDQRLI